MQQRMRVVFLGDSVTAGVGLSDGQPTYVQLLDAHCHQCALPVECIASALDGIDTGYALKRFGRMVTALDPDWVVVMLGLNDAQPAGQRTQIAPSAFQNNLLGLVDRILTLGARPVLVAPNPRLNCCAGDMPQQVDLMPPYVAALRQTAEQADLPCVDIYARFCGGDWQTLMPDGVHPGVAGHRLIADTLASELACFWPSTQPAESATTNDPERHASARK